MRPQEMIKEMEMDLLSCKSNIKRSSPLKKGSTNFVFDCESDIEQDTSRIVNKIKEYSFENCEQSSFISNNNSVVIYSPQMKQTEKRQKKTQYTPIVTKDDYHVMSLSTESYDDRIREYNDQKSYFIKPITGKKSISKDMSKLKDISFHESDFSFEMPKVSKAKEIQGLEFLGSDIEVCED